MAKYDEMREKAEEPVWFRTRKTGIANQVDSVWHIAYLRARPVEYEELPGSPYEEGVPVAITNDTGTASNTRVRGK